jgi:hypothetical protein
MSTATVFPGILGAFVAFVGRPQAMWDLDGGLDNGQVWLECSCGAQLNLARSTGAESDIAARG